MKFGDSLYPAKLDILEVAEDAGFSHKSGAKDKVMKRCHKVFTFK